MKNEPIVNWGWVGIHHVYCYILEMKPWRFPMSSAGNTPGWQEVRDCVEWGAFHYEDWTSLASTENTNTQKLFELCKHMYFLRFMF